MSNENTVTAAPGGFENPAGAASSDPERTTTRI